MSFWLFLFSSENKTICKYCNSGSSSNNCKECEYFSGEVKCTECNSDSFLADGKCIKVALEVAQIAFMKMENGYVINAKRIIF